MIRELLISDDGDEMPSTDIAIGLTTENLLDVLACRRRRIIIRRLAACREDGQRALSLDDLVDFVTAVESEQDSDSKASDRRKSVYIGIYQCHIPTLEEVGLVQLDDENTVHIGCDIVEIAQLLTIIEQASRDTESEDLDGHYVGELDG